MTEFIELQVDCKPEFREILMAEASHLGFESTLETEAGFNAYVKKGLFKKEWLTVLSGKYTSITSLKMQTSTIVNKNWNEEWERNFDPVIIEDKCVVRASFHEPVPDVPIQIIINPKMAFGTGHHETTSTIMKLQFELDHSERNVLDCGCGTGILSILAHKLGAVEITAIDIDEWAVNNALENAGLNGIEEITFLQNSIRQFDFSTQYDIVLANINKNVLLDEIPRYSEALKVGGHLLLSGFYVHDLPEIKLLSEQNELKFLKYKALNDWVAVVFIKNQTYQRQE